MYPVLAPGDEVLVDRRAYKRKSPQIGEIVIAQHPHNSDLRIIKRVTGSLPDGRLILEGDFEEASTDSRDYGPVAVSLIVGRVTSRFPG